MVKASHIQAVTFDVGGTLIRPWPSVGHVYAEVAAAHGYPGLPADVLSHRFSVAFHSRPAFDHTPEDWADIVVEALAGLVPEPAARDFFPELYERFAQPGAWRIFDDVWPTLDALAAQGLRLGIISNWDDRLRPLLKRLGLAKRFEVTVVSCEVGCAKPALGIFRRAVQELGLPARAVLHVGDDLAMDVQGARAAGLHALQITRTPAPEAKVRIRSLLELPPRVAAPQMRE